MFLCVEVITPNGLILNPEEHLKLVILELVFMFLMIVCLN